MNKKELAFWADEMKTLDRLYRGRMAEWQRLVDLYDLQFDERIRDLQPSDIVRVSRFYPIVRQIISTIAFRYPKQFFLIEDEEGDQVAELLERASAAFFRLANVRDHMHQAIFDALFCGVGWLRLDYNPPGDTMIAPYIANDDMADDMVAVSRVAPGCVHLDPACPPHRLGHARYIREKMWMPLKFLRDDPNVQHKRQLSATAAGNSADDLMFGEVMGAQSDTEERQALKESIDNGEFVLVDRIHDRIGRRLIMFADGVEDPILEQEHPFIKRSFPQMIDSVGNLIFAEDETGELSEPVLDIEGGIPAAGWLVENGFPFVPIKFDMHSASFYPMGQMAYLEDLQAGIIEQISRRSDLLKRTARQGVVAESEVLANPEILEKLRAGRDGEFQTVQDINSIRELSYSSVPPDLYAHEQSLLSYEDQIAAVQPPAPGESDTATEAAVVAAAAQLNGNWMEAKVSQAYEMVVRNAFQIMGDPRYTPEDFTINVAPEGASQIVRALRTSDFLWNFRIHSRVGSTQPLYEQLEQDRFLAFYDRAANRPNFDQVELDKAMASAFDVIDVEKLMVSDVNVEAQRAAQLENDRFMNGQDTDVLIEQDHPTHTDTHNMYRDHPAYMQLMQAAQMTDPAGRPLNPQAQQQIQQIDAVVAQHIQGHAEAQQQQQQNAMGQPAGGGGSPSMGLDLQGQVASNAQRISDAAQVEAAETMRSS
tara:strand:+ start:3737 stop:5860 length:2124 start_codon:yes stop_codon:yes gene_type:complete